MSRGDGGLDGFRDVHLTSQWNGGIPLGCQIETKPS
jgi:hypothetical protein